MSKRTKSTKATNQAYSPEFRETAIKLSLGGQKSIAEVARELDIPARKLYDWVSAWKKKNDQGQSRSNGSDDELRKLQKRNKELEMENEILKKAAAYFAKTLL